MKIIWLGHSGFRIEIGNQVLLVDPWFTGNPMFEGQDRAAAIAGATHLLVSHGHGDHSGDALTIAKDLSIPIVGIYDLISFWEASEGISGVGFNKGGTVMLGDVAVTMVGATHSSSIGTDHGPIYAGAEAGFMIAGEGEVIYFSGDTDVMADMAVFEALHHPTIGILSAGGHFTMDMARASYAASTYFNFRKVIPCHYKTFPLLAQDASEMTAALGAGKVAEPVVMQPVQL